MPTLKFVDLFAGIGGFSLGLTHAGMMCVGQVEINKFCQKILMKYWPDVKRIGDIRDVTGTEFGAVDLVCGGFPCQPFSTAGKRRGKEDGRHLWPEMFRIIKEARPDWVVGENVAGIVKMELNQVLSDLESEGYITQPIIIPACAVNAPHRRDRVWIIAYNNDTGNGTPGSGIDENRQAVSEEPEQPQFGNSRQDSDVADTERQGLERRYGNEREAIAGFRQSNSWAENWYEAATRLCRMDDGISRRIHRTKRLKALGNAVVPQIVEIIGRAIIAAEGNSNQ